MANQLIKHCLHLVALSASTFAFAAQAQAAPVLTQPNSNGITLQSWTPVDADGWGGDPPSTRLYEAVVRTDDIFVNHAPVDVKVRVLVPANYQADQTRKYQVLLLLHGAGGGADSWSSDPFGPVQSIVDELGEELIVVMPDGGAAGWYSDWQGPTNGGFKPAWEHFHISQLVPWIDANFRTNKLRSERTVAGLSMGGYGALKYAAKYNTLFSAVGSFSGVADLKDEDLQFWIGQSMFLFGAKFGPHGAFDPTGSYLMTFPFIDDELEETKRMNNLFGTPVSGEWWDANPSAMSSKYSGLKLGLYVGRDSWDGFETYIARTNDTLHQKLKDSGVPHRYCTGLGEHQPAYWVQDLKDFLKYVYDDALPTNCTGNANWLLKP